MMRHLAVVAVRVASCFYPMPMTMQRPDEEIRRTAMELTALAESGLAYCRDQFDIERFHRIGTIARELMHHVSSEELPAYERAVASVAGYTTPKLDVRGGVFAPDGRVLLVREVSDDQWTLPGGWCDVLETPRQAVEREILEEAGIRVSAIHLAGLLDREAWPHHPPYDRHVYKLFFVCNQLGDVDPDFASNETSEVAWHPVDDLPQLSIARVLPEQIQMLHRHWQNPEPAHFD